MSKSINAVSKSTNMKFKIVPKSASKSANIVPKYTDDDKVVAKKVLGDLRRLQGKDSDDKNTKKINVKVLSKVEEKKPIERKDIDNLIPSNLCLPVNLLKLLKDDYIIGVTYKLDNSRSHAGTNDTINITCTYFYVLKKSIVEDDVNYRNKDLYEGKLKNNPNVDQRKGIDMIHCMMCSSNVSDPLNLYNTKISVPNYTKDYQSKNTVYVNQYVYVRHSVHLYNRNQLTSYKKELEPREEVKRLIDQKYFE
jgi:hypothetical protein